MASEMADNMELASEQVKLLPCPFCGAAPELSHPHNSLGRIYYWVACSCRACGPDSQEIAGAIRLWNARSDLVDAKVRAAREDSIAQALRDERVALASDIRQAVEAVPDKFPPTPSGAQDSRNGPRVKTDLLAAIDRVLAEKYSEVKQ